MSRLEPVRAWEESVVIPTYEPLPADRNPMFLENRVYQGSSGKVYPLPFIDRISTAKTDRRWQAIHMENEFLKVMLLPELGGRIHAILDKTNGYEVIYRQEVIKPALVGLAGPWVSGGIEFNWPQHHRPGTFMPVDSVIEESFDGSVTVWMSEHDPLSRMKGMHGVCLHPGRSYLELKVRLYNRTPMIQTFLWWANVAMKVHELYQSFFPPDVECVADHAKRAMSRYPSCEGRYYGVDYGGRAKQGVPAAEAPRKFLPPPGRYEPNDLSWYANIPVPTSYMCVGSQGDFFGGYDHAAGAGIVHVANHHISPGKKQWTWGNHEFGYAWDRNLSEDEAPYIELMAGVYTDNQPGFSFLLPGETKTFSQFWYPIREIGLVQCANVDAAVSLNVVGRDARVGVITSERLEQARFMLEAKGGRPLWKRTATIGPNEPLVANFKLPASVIKSQLRLTVKSAEGRVVIEHQLQERALRKLPEAATEPAEPGEVASADELFLIGLHLEQYRHATRKPEDYWREALRRDALDWRCNNALGRWHLQRGEFVAAAARFRLSIERLTHRNPNPHDGEPHYNLGLALRFMGEDDAAYDAFYKSTWNYAWQSAGYLALAELDLRAQRWERVLDHLDRSLRDQIDQLKARGLKAIVLRKLGREQEADVLIRKTLELDPLDFFARWLAGKSMSCDLQVRLDLAFDLARAGLYKEGLEILNDATLDTACGAAPLAGYLRGYLLQLAGDSRRAKEQYAVASNACSNYCFPARLDEINMFRAAMEANPRDPMAAYYLGNFFYDRRRQADAIALWERAAKVKPSFPTVWRNLGIAYFNFARAPLKAKAAYERALAADTHDARLLFERDQLWKRMNVSPEKRLVELERRPALVASRDDLSIEMCDLLNLVGRHEDALAIISSRKFQPWEGGEGQAMKQHVRTHLASGRRALMANDASAARWHFEQALSNPANLGEAKHLLSNQSEIHYLLGVACAAAQYEAASRHHFGLAAEYTGDFQEMSVRTYSESTYFSAMAHRRLGRKRRADTLLKNLLKYAKELRRAPARIDYFATSLPALLLFEDDLQRRQETMSFFLETQARMGLGDRKRAMSLLRTVLRRDPSHGMAIDLLREAKESPATRRSRSAAKA